MAERKVQQLMHLSTSKSGFSQYACNYGANYLASNPVYIISVSRGSVSGFPSDLSKLTDYFSEIIEKAIYNEEGLETGRSSVNGCDGIYLDFRTEDEVKKAKADREEKQKEWEAKKAQK